MFILTTFYGCNLPLDVKSYYVKIAPIGNSDYPRDTVYISSEKLDIAHAADYDGNDVALVTDRQTFGKIIDFVKENYRVQPKRKTFNEFGSLNISLYHSNSMAVEYNLDGQQSVKFLKDMTTVLLDDNLDPHVIKALKEHALAHIDY